MPRYAIEDSDGKVVNFVEWDGKSNWRPPPGMTLRRDEPDPPPPLAERLAKFDVLADRVDALEVLVRKLPVPPQRSFSTQPTKE